MALTKLAIYTELLETRNEIAELKRKLEVAKNLIVFCEAYLDDQRNLDLFEADLINGSVTQATFEEEVKKAKQIIM